jgi:hypothetical protein
MNSRFLRFSEALPGRCRSQLRSHPEPAKRSQIEECIYDLKKKKETGPEASGPDGSLFFEIREEQGENPAFRRKSGAEAQLFISSHSKVLRGGPWLFITVERRTLNPAKPLFHQHHLLYALEFLPV